MKFSLFFVAATCLLLRPASADVIFSIENVTVTPGDTAVVGVFAHATAGETLLSYQLPIDIGLDGRTLPVAPDATPGIAGFGSPEAVDVDGFGGRTSQHGFPRPTFHSGLRWDFLTTLDLHLCFQQTR